MKNIFNFIYLALVFSCSQPDSGNRDKVNNDVKANPVTVSSKTPDTISHKKRTDAIVNRIIDTTLLMNISTEILKSIKTKNYNKLATFIHPQDGVRFSPYANISLNDRKFLGSELIQLAKQSKPIDWGSSWDEGTELLTIGQYFKKFVYDVDFLNAELKSINKFHSQGTDLNNITDVYPGCDVTEFFFSGFDEKNGGMDFRGLRLVFKLLDKHPFLIAIVHDEWTP